MNLSISDFDDFQGEKSVFYLFFVIKKIVVIFRFDQFLLLFLK